MHATTAFVDPLRAANYLAGEHRFQWVFLSLDGGPITASNGMVLHTDRLADFDRALQWLVVSASWTPEQHQDKRLLRVLKLHARQNTTLCGLDTGAFLFGYAGLLDGRKATVHYEHINAFKELFNQISVSDERYVWDQNIVTCCGGQAASDVSLQLIQQTLGVSIADAAAQYIFHNTAANVQTNYVTTSQSLGINTLDNNPPSANNSGTNNSANQVIPRIMRQATHIMESNLEQTLSIPEIASKLNVSQRQLERLFNQHLEQTAAHYYLDLRLNRARGLITQTDMQIVDVAVACGFVSAVHFSRVYKKRFALTPKQDRVSGRVPFEFRNVQGSQSF